MRKLVWLGIASALLGCGSSRSTSRGDASRDAVADVVGIDAPTGLSDAADGRLDLGTSDAPGAPDAGRLETAGVPDAASFETPSSPADAADGRLDLVTSDAPGAPDAAKDEGSGGPSDTEGTTIDLAKRETPEAADTAKSETPEALPDARGDVWDAETGERCTCDDVVSPSGAPAKLSWGCFCSVEDCGKTLAYFVDYADGGKVLTTGKGTVLVKEYADCSLVMVQAKTYGDYSRTSEYVFDLATGALVGARVFLDDRQHSCPFPLTDSGILWVFGYESGDYPVSTSCRESGCLAGSGTCSGVDAL